MSIQLHGMYRGGVILPEYPLPLAEGTEVSVTITIGNGNGGLSRMQTDLNPPDAPVLSSIELQSRLDRDAVSIGSLPVDFSRADIYQDHD